MKKIAFTIFTLCSTLQLSPLKKENIHRYMMATIEQAKGNKDKAAQWYDKIMSSKKPPIHVNKGYIHLLHDQGDFEKIITIMPKIDTLFKDNPEIQLIFISALKKAGNTTQAHDQLLRLSRTFKTHPEIVFQSAQLFIEKKELSNALSLINDYLNSTPHRNNNFVFFFLKAQVYSQLKEFKKAKQEIEKCLKAHPQFPQGWLLFSALEEQQGELQKAIEGYTSYLQIIGPNKQVEQHILELSLKQKNLKKGTPLTGSLFNAHRPCFEKALMLFKTKEYKAALQQINICLEQNPHHTHARLLKVQVLAELKQFTEIITLLTQWSAQENDNPIWLQTLHLLYRLPNTPSSAIINAFEHISAKKSNQLLPLLYLSDLYTRANNNDKAILLHKKTAIHVKDPELKTRILYQAGLLEYEQGRFNTMAETLKSALALKADFPPLLNLLAYYYATEEKNYTQAQNLLNTALKKDTYNPHFLDTQALIFYKQGNYAKALNLLTKITKQAPHDSTILIHLAKTNHKLNNAKQAQKTIALAEKHAHNKYEKTTSKKLALQWKNKK